MIFKQLMNTYFEEQYSEISIQDASFINIYYKVGEKYVFVPCSISAYDIKKAEEKYNIKLDVKGYVGEIVNEVATLIQPEIPKNSYLKFDIYLLLFYSDEVDVKGDEILEVENNKFCCRKIFMKYDKECDPNDENSIFKQFERKFLFFNILNEFKKSENDIEEPNMVKEILTEDNEQMFELDKYTFLELKSKLMDLYKKYGIGE